MYYFEKVAKMTEKQKEDSKIVGAGISGAGILAGSGAAFSKAKKRQDELFGVISGLKHGTSDKNWERIKVEGLKADMGGIGGESEYADNPSFLNESKGKVHVTNNDKNAKSYAWKSQYVSEESDEYKKAIKEAEKLKAKYYNKVVLGEGESSYYDWEPKSLDELNVTEEQAIKMDSEIDKMYAKASSIYNKTKKSNTGNGRVVDIKMGYNKWKNDFEMDPLGGGEYYIDGTKPKNLEKGKLYAARGSVDIHPEEILENGVKDIDRFKYRLKHLPAYIRENPRRFAKGAVPLATGVAMAGAGAAMLGSSIDNLKRQKQLEKKASYKELIYKESER